MHYLMGYGCVIISLECDCHCTLFSAEIKSFVRRFLRAHLALMPNTHPASLLAIL